MRVIRALNPYMADNPDALAQVAQQPYDTETIVNSAGQMYAMQVGDKLIQQLHGMNGATQRAIISRLSPGQRAAIGQMGYQPPRRDESGYFSTAVDMAVKPLSVISHGVAGIPGVKEGFNDVMGALTWVGNWPGHLYRATVVNQKDNPWGVLGAAVLGGLAVGLAPVTGGGSLAALGAIGLGALGGATIGSIATSSPTDWGRAFNASWNGERTFRPDAIKRVGEMLTDPRMNGLAQDLADADIDPVTFAKEMAGQREMDPNSQLRKIEKLADHMAEHGSTEWQQAVSAMTNSLQVPEFQTAVATLFNSKISIGRDFAEAIPLVDKGDLTYSLLSGATDAIMMVALDPTLALGYTTKAWRAARYTFSAFDGAEAGTEFVNFVKARPAVLRTYQGLADAVADGNIRKLYNEAPHLKGLYGQLLDYKQLLVDQGSHARFGVDDVLKYFSGQQNMRPLLEGIGSVKNAKGLQLVAQSYPRMVFRHFSGTARAFVDGMADISTEAKLQRLITTSAKTAEREGGVSYSKLADDIKYHMDNGMPRNLANLEAMNTQIVHLAMQYGEDTALMVPTWTDDAVNAQGLMSRPWRIVEQPHEGAYVFGRRVAQTARSTHLPVLGKSVGKLGEFLTAASTMTIKGKAIALVGHESAPEIKAFAELGRYMGMPSYYRKVWTDVMLNSPSPAARYHAMHGYIGNMLSLTGLDTTVEGSNMVKQYLEAARKMYGTSDEIMVNGHLMHTGLFLNEQADKVVMPNLFEVRKAAITGGWGRLMGVADLPVIEPMMTKIWKPAVLLRLGFIPRAAGEEFVSYMLRGGLGSLLQESGARFLGTREAAISASATAGMIDRGALESMTTAEKILASRQNFSKLPAHIRPLARIMARGNWEDPVMGKMLRYSKWLSERLAEGAGHADFAYGSKEAQMVAQSVFGTHNLEARAKTILLGNEHSLRRMLVGGVNEDLVEAGRLWGQQHMTTVMRDLSAVNMGPVDPGLDGTKIFKKLVEDPDTGETRPVRMVSEGGVRTTLANGDENFENAVHESWERPLADPANRRVQLNVTSRVKGGANVNEEDMYPLLDKLTGWDSRNPHQLQARLIASELMGDFNREHWNAMIRDLHAKGHVRIAVSLEQDLKKLTTPGYQDVVDALKEGKAALRVRDFPAPASFMAAQMQFDDLIEELDKVVAPSLKYLDGLDPVSRGFAVQLLEGNMMAGPVKSPYRIWKQAAAGTEGAQARAARTTSEGAEAWLDSHPNRATVRRLTPGKPEPPVPEGRTRMYRGENPNVTEPRAPALASDKAAAAEEARQYQGRYFSRDRSFAESFSNMDGPGGKVLYVDIPSEEVARWGGFDLALNLQHRVTGGAGDVGAHTFLYDDLNAAKGDQLSQLYGHYMDPHYHDSGVVSSLRGLQLDEQGQFIDAGMHNASVNLYTVPVFPQSEVGAPTLSDILNAAANPEIIIQNRRLVSRLLGAEGIQFGEPAALVADYRLANELSLIDARLAGVADDARTMPLVMREDRAITSGKRHSYLFADKSTREGGEARLWFGDRPVLEHRLAPVGDSLKDPIIDMADDSVSRFNDVIRRGRQSKVTFKERIADEEGNTEALAHRWNNGKPTPVQPGEELGLSEMNRLVDDQGQAIHYGDTKYTASTYDEAEAGQPTGDVMWEGVSNAFRDAWAEEYGFSRLRRKEEASQFSLPGRRVQSFDLVTMPRSTPLDVKRVHPDDLPSHAIYEVAKETKVGNFQAFVNFGFDRVVGPSIDAIVRRPMAFHHFANRYINAKNSLKFTLDPDLTEQIAKLAGDFALRFDDGVTAENVARYVKDVIHYQGDENALNWSTDHALSYLRGSSPSELEDLLDSTVRLTSRDRSLRATTVQNAANQLKGIGHTRLASMFSDKVDMATVVDAAEALLPQGALRSQDALVRALQSEIGGEAMRDSAFLRYVDSQKDGWEKLIAARTNLAFQREAAGEIAATAAVTDALPFIDSHEFKTQFADHAKGYIPFWYAEENFMKRWARGLMDEGPSMVRKAQLAYMGIKQAGIVRTDENGRDWFVYPGSGLLFDVIGRIPGMAQLRNMGIMFQTPTDQMLPGLNNKFGAPSFNPLVTIPMDLVSSLFPELAPAERAVLGDFSAGQGALNQLIPSTLRNVASAVTGDAASSTRYASAMMTAIAYAEAHGQAPGDNATTGEVDAFMDQMRRQARIVVMVQAIGGFIVPGAPSEVAGGRSANMAGLDVGNPAEYLSTEYLQLVRTLGVENGTQKFLELYPEKGIDGIVNPLAYTVPRNVSTTGAPIPSTEAALKFTTDNADYFSEMPNAAPWLIPDSFSDERSQYAFDQQIADGMRQRRTPEELFTAMKFKIGAQEYFKMKDAYTGAIDEAVNRNDKATADRLKTEMANKLDIFKITHPIFATQLASSDGREKRAGVISEMRTVVDDPAAPQSPQLEGTRLAMHAFDRYSVRLGVLQNDHTAAGRIAVDNLKTMYESYMTQLVQSHPEISAFWVSILKPEASLG